MTNEISTEDVEIFLSCDSCSVEIIRNLLNGVYTSEQLKTDYFMAMDDIHMKDKY